MPRLELTMFIFDHKDEQMAEFNKAQETPDCGDVGSVDLVTYEATAVIEHFPLIPTVGMALGARGELFVIEELEQLGEMSYKASCNYLNCCTFQKESSPTSAHFRYRRRITMDEMRKRLEAGVADGIKWTVKPKLPNISAQTGVAPQ